MEMGLIQNLSFMDLVQVLIEMVTKALQLNQNIPLMDTKILS